MEREKKQFRLFDVYRYWSTGTISKIKGINTYKIHRNFDKFEIKIQYSNGSKVEFIAKNEDELKEVISNVNKQLKNCSKPGRKQKVNY
jgi:hypothetical protein